MSHVTSIETKILIHLPHPAPSSRTKEPCGIWTACVAMQSARRRAAPHTPVPCAPAAPSTATKGANPGRPGTTRRRGASSASSSSSSMCAGCRVHSPLSSTYHARSLARPLRKRRTHAYDEIRTKMKKKIEGVSEIHNQPWLTSSRRHGLILSKYGNPGPSIRRICQMFATRVEWSPPPDGKVNA